jgi:hypothetical protein
VFTKPIKEQKLSDLPPPRRLTYTLNLGQWDSVIKGVANGGDGYAMYIAMKGGAEKKRLFPNAFFTKEEFDQDLAQMRQTLYPTRPHKRKFPG